MNISNLVLALIMIPSLVLLVKTLNKKMSVKQSDSTININSNFSNRNNSSYYAEKNELETRLHTLEEKELIEIVLKEWDTRQEKLDKEIFLLENILKECKDEKTHIQTELRYLDLLEQRKTSQLYYGRCLSFDNSELVSKLLDGEFFVKIEEAEKIVKEADDKTYFSTFDYQKKEKLYENLSLTFAIIGPFFMPQIFYSLFFALKDLIKTGILDDFFSYIFIGYMVWGFTAIVSIPIGYFISCFVIPKLLKKLILNDKASESLNKEMTKLAVTGAATGIFSGLLVNKHIKDNKVDIKE